MAVSVTGVLIAAFGPVFSDTELVSANAFELGILDIAVSPASTLLTLGQMAPGDRVTGPLTLSNEGSLQARYALRLFSTEDHFASALEMTVKTGVTNCDNDGFAVDGDVLYGPDEAGSIDGISAFGNPATGPDFGDMLLDPEAREILCFGLEFPMSGDNSLQSASTTITLLFMSEFAVPD